MSPLERYSAPIVAMGTPLPFAGVCGERAICCLLAILASCLCSGISVVMGGLALLAAAIISFLAELHSAKLLGTGLSQIVAIEAPGRATTKAHVPQGCFNTCLTVDGIPVVAGCPTAKGEPEDMTPRLPSHFDRLRITADARHRWLTNAGATLFDKGRRINPWYWLVRSIDEGSRERRRFV